MRVSHFAAFCAILTSWIHVGIGQRRQALKGARQHHGRDHLHRAADLKDPFNDITLDVIFTDPAGVRRRVPAFWAGGRGWKVRYASPLVGTHSFSERSVLSPPPPDCRVWEGNGRRDRVHRRTTRYSFMVRCASLPAGDISSRRTAAPFFWLGDTWWMGLTKRLAWPEEFQKLVADRRAKGLMSSRSWLALYPDMPAFDEAGATERGFHGEKITPASSPEYLMPRIRKDHVSGRSGHRAGASSGHGISTAVLGQEKMCQHQRYVYANGARCRSSGASRGRLNLPITRVPIFPKKGQKQTAEWEKVLNVRQKASTPLAGSHSHPTGIPLAQAIAGRAEGFFAVDSTCCRRRTGRWRRSRRRWGVKVFDIAKPPMPRSTAEPSYECCSITRRGGGSPRLLGLLGGRVKGYTYGPTAFGNSTRRDQPYGPFRLPVRITARLPGMMR